jgi:hypothetical protein
VNAASRDSVRPLHRRPWLWAAAFLIAVAASSALRISEAIDPTTGYILLACAMGILIPMTRAATAQQEACGAASPAALRYTRGIMLASFVYVAGLGTAVWLNDTLTFSRGTAFFVSLLPAVPTIAIVGVMARYLMEENDEYLRHRAMIANLFGLGAVLGIGSFWGFLETFEVVPHVPAWWAVPIWAIGMGAGQGVLALRNRTAGDERGGDE